jgi:hypothetical protein
MIGDFPGDDAVTWLNDIDLLDQVAYRPANV